MKKKLIEVALPLDDINNACVREKSIRHGHPSTLHLWWARRPLAAARAVIWASLVDDPSSHPELFPTEEAQNKERDRLFSILKDLVIWENSNNQEVLNRAREEIKKSTGNNPPALLDPFMGGGAIPLEAQRLGLKAYGADLNPVAVMINKAMYEIPPRFRNQKPVNPDARLSANDQYPGAQGLAADVEYYGNMLKEMAYKKIGHLYPKAKYNDPKSGEEKEATVIAWIWARTVKCLNPVCGAEVPLVHSFDLSKKKGQERHIEISYDENRKVVFSIHAGTHRNDEGTISRNGAVCPYCGASIDYPTIRSALEENRYTDELEAVVLDTASGRTYISAEVGRNTAIAVELPEVVPSTKMTGKAVGNIGLYGFKETSQLFTSRQIVMLTTLSDLLPEIRQQVIKDCSTRLPADNRHLAEGGSGALAYAEAISVYLAFLIDKMTDYHSSFCSWNAPGQKMRNVFGRQAIPMVWDYAECNPFCSSSGSLDNMLAWVWKAIKDFPHEHIAGEAVQWDATQDNGLRNIMVSSDPPYYDNICYADLSDFFYVWMRHSLKDVYPAVFGTISTPKEPELIASPYRFKKKSEAKEFFEDGMLEACRNIYKYSREDVPVTIYYAFKQSDTDDSGSASTGWETMLSAIIKAGFSITGTWPLNTEREGRSIAVGSNALASSIVIVCRKVTESKPSTTLRNFIDELKSEMLPALKKLQASNIAPVDLAQSAIGPGIAVYSRYESIINADGSALTVRDALRLINRELDAHLNELNSGIDPASSLCMTMYMQKGFNQWKYGEIETLANAKNISVDTLDKAGLLRSEKGTVELLTREDIADMKVVATHPYSWLNTQQCVKAYSKKGNEGVSRMFALLSDSEIADVKSLCYQLFSIADRKGWTSEALAYNSVISCWEDAYKQSFDIRKNMADEQLTLDFEG